MSSKAFVPLIVSTLAFTGYSDVNQSNPVDETERAVNCSYPPSGEPAKPVDPPSDEDVLDAGEIKVALHLTAGNVEITMSRSTTPCIINSFTLLAQQDWFDKTRCHRLTDYDIFVLQCGDLIGTGKGGSGYTVPDESSPRTTGSGREGSVAIYSKGTAAMANIGRPNIAELQFFIVWEDSQLSPDYVVFDTVDEGGLAVVQGIAAQGVDETDGTSPIAETVINSVTLS